MLLLKSFFVCLLAAIVLADGETARDFQCPLCNEFVRAVETISTSDSTLNVTEALLVTCSTSAAFDGCSFVLPAFARWVSQHQEAVELSWSVVSRLLAHRASFEVCQEMKLCPKSERYESFKLAHPPASPDDLLDLRVALPHGERGTDHVRISLIQQSSSFTRAAGASESFWDYDEQFQFFWKDKSLKTAVKHFEGPSTVYSMPVNATSHVNITVQIPRPGKDGFTALIIGDPCFTGKYVSCANGDTFKIFERLTTILNTALGTPLGGTDLWFLLGDNFYDPHGDLGPQFFSSLTLQTKSKPIVTVVGNHDIWQHGSPHAKSGHDTFGNGFMQYYLMDVESSIHGDTPLNFSVVPTLDAAISDDEWPNLPPLENFFTYNHVGNTVIISFSGAHLRHKTDPLFEKACAFVGKVDPSFVVVIGHWSGVNLGCRHLMDTKEVHAHITTLPGCSHMSDRIKWLEGHSHCNHIVSNNTGFQLGGFGMGGCGNFGIPYISTLNDTIEVGYFPIVGGNGTIPNSEEKNDAGDLQFSMINDCIATQGLMACARQYAVPWLSQKK